MLDYGVIRTKLDLLRGPQMHESMELLFVTSLPEKGPGVQCLEEVILVAGTLGLGKGAES